MTSTDTGGQAFEVLSASDHVQGSREAKVTVVEYGDFECPSCGQAYPAVKIMLERFGVRLCFAFRHFPQMEVHPHARIAAEAAEAAGRQGKFWQMHDLLFENQQHLKPNNLRQYAQRLELDLDLFDREMRQHAHLQYIQEHIRRGEQSQIRGTPAFFVNGLLTDVSFGMEHLQEAIERSLRT